MTLLDFEELAAYWADHPPVHILVAAYLGLERPKHTGSSSRTRDTPSRRGDGVGSDVGSILADLGPGFASGDVHAGLASVELDFAELRRKSATGAIEAGR